MKRTLGLLGGGVLAVLLIVVLAIADAKVFEKDAEYSSLYKATLAEAHSRFKAADKRVPAKPPMDEFGGAAGPQTPTPVGGVGGPNAALQLQQQRAMQGASGMTPGVGGRSTFQNFAGQNAPPHLAAPASGGVGQAHAHDDGGIHLKQGGDLLARGMLDQAIAEFRLALQENPSRHLAQHYIGDALRAQGKIEEAVAAYRKTLEMNPSYYCCHVHIGEMLTTAGKTSEAEEEFGKAVTGYRQQVSEGGPQAGVAAYHLAKFYVDRQRNAAESIVLAEQAVSAAPNQAVYLHLLARSYELAGRKSDAVSTIDRAIQLNPEHVEHYKNYRAQLLGAPAATPPATNPPLLP